MTLHKNKASSVSFVYPGFCSLALHMSDLHQQEENNSAQHNVFSSLVVVQHNIESNER